MLEGEVRDTAAWKNTGGLKRVMTLAGFPLFFIVSSKADPPKSHFKVIFLFSTTTDSNADLEKNNYSCGPG